MRSLSFIVSVLLAGSAYAQQGSAVFTPTQRDLSVPTYINATIVRVDNRNHTVRFRSASGEVSLAVDSRAVRDLGRLRAGDEVVLGYEIDESTGRPMIVTAMPAGQAGGTVRAASTSSFSTVTGRVVSFDPTAGTVVLSDALGRTEMLSVQGSALGALAQVRPGQQVNVSLVPGAAMGGFVGGVGAFGTVNGITPVASPTFVTGRIATVNTTTGAVTLRTEFGDQMFVLPSTVNARTLRAGQDVRFNLSGRTDDRSFTSVTTLGPTTAAVPSTFSTPGMTSGTVPFTTASLPGPGTTPVGTTTGNFAGTLPTAVGSAPGTLPTGAQFNSPLGTQVNAGGIAGATGVNNATGMNGTAGGVNAANTTGVNGATGVNNGATGVNTANIGLGGGFGTVSFPSSPFGSGVPSLPSTTGQLNVVPPPASAPAGVADTLPVGALRDVATRDYDYAVHTMAQKANEIDAHWFRYRDGCLRSSSTNAEIDRNLYGSNRDREWYVLFSGDVRTPADDNCRQLVIEMTRMADDWRSNMSRIEDTARKNDVLPGVMREIRARYRVDF